MFPWLFIALWLTVEAARALGVEPPVEPIQELVFQEDRTAVLALTALLACLVGPVAEECFFRGVVFAALRRRVSRAAAMGVSAGAFALLHGNPIGFPSIWLLGCLLAYLYERTGSLAAPLAVHVLHNTLLMSTALMVRRVMELVG
jgi:membrane protease YdiL (CAAX protease family)